jgi:hypothetical protein
MHAKDELLTQMDAVLMRVLCTKKTKTLELIIKKRIGKNTRNKLLQKDANTGVFRILCDRHRMLVNVADQKTGAATAALPI